MASQQSGACPAVAIGGPTYEDENGCPVPCPKSGEIDGIPEGCPLSTDEMTTSDIPDIVPTTQTPSIPNSENTGVGPPTQTYTFENFFTLRSSELSTTPDSSKVTLSPHIAVSNGSDQIIESLLSTLGKQANVTIVEPTFSIYFINRCKLHDIPIESIPLNEKRIIVFRIQDS